MDSQRFLPAVAPPARAGYANIQTRKRRLQRKHTQASYRHMKTQLLSLLKPMPIAVFSTDVESFRYSLYTDAEVKTEADNKVQTISINRCHWCGIWTPLPERQINIAISEEIIVRDKSKEAVEAFAAEVLPIQPVLEEATVADILEVAIATDADPDKNNIASDDAALDHTIVDPGDIIDLADLLSPSLCEIVSSLEGANHRDMLKELRGQRVAAFKARAAQGSKQVPPGFSWLSIDVSRHAFCLTQPSQPQPFIQPVPNPLFKKDEATGECKQQ